MLWGLTDKGVPDHWASGENHVSYDELPTEKAVTEFIRVAAEEAAAAKAVTEAAAAEEAAEEATAAEEAAVKAAAELAAAAEAAAAEEAAAAMESSLQRQIRQRDHMLGTMESKVTISATVDNALEAAIKAAVAEPGAEESLLHQIAQRDQMLAAMHRSPEEVTPRLTSSLFQNYSPSSPSGPSSPIDRGTLVQQPEDIQLQDRGTDTDSERWPEQDDYDQGGTVITDFSVGIPSDTDTEVFYDSDDTHTESIQENEPEVESSHALVFRSSFDPIAIPDDLSSPIQNDSSQPPERVYRNDGTFQGVMPPEGAPHEGAAGVGAPQVLGHNVHLLQGPPG